MPGSRSAFTWSATAGCTRRLIHRNDFGEVSSVWSSASGMSSKGARRAAALTGSPTPRGCTKRDSALADVASGAPRRSTRGPRRAGSVTVREYCRSASVANSVCRRIWSWASRDTTPPNATASTAARIRTRVRSFPVTGWATSPDDALPPHERGPRPAVRTPRHVLASLANLLTAGRGHAELPGARLHAAGRAQRGHLDFELPEQ